MTPEQAAATLHAEFQDRPWYRRVVLGRSDGEPALFLFVAGEEDRGRTGVPLVWETYPVLVRVEKDARAAGSPYLR